jgi:hypothetical protein
MERDEYLSYRRKFPVSVKLAIIAESPPVSGKYFYNPAGVITELLFAALMLQLGDAPISKEDRSRAFRQRGWVLVDATYKPINVEGVNRNRVIAQEYPVLGDDLTRLLPNRSTPIILIKANVCRVLQPKLTEDGFTVLDNDIVVYFPGSGRQKDFHRQFKAVLKNLRE